MKTLMFFSFQESLRVAQRRRCLKKLLLSQKLQNERSRSSYEVEGFAVSNQWKPSLSYYSVQPVNGTKNAFSYSGLIHSEPFVPRQNRAEAF